jgi:hypothetical protein
MVKTNTASMLDRIGGMTNLSLFNKEIKLNLYINVVYDTNINVYLLRKKKKTNKKKKKKNYIPLAHLKSLLLIHWYSMMNTMKQKMDMKQWTTVR